MMTPQSGCFRSLFDQIPYAIGQLRALANPVIDALVIEAQTHFLTASPGVEETQTLDITPITGPATVSHSDVIIRALLGTTA